VIKYRRVRWAGHIARTEDKRGVYRVLVRRPVGKRLRVRPRRRWDDNIKTDLRERGWGGMDWCDLFQDRGKWLAFVNTIMDPGAP
jgi:hypothetical protein